MNSSKVDTFLMSKGSCFPSKSIPMMKERLQAIDDSRWPMLQMQNFKSPIVAFIISFFFGWLGIDRFMIGQTGLGVAKLLTGGGFGLWALIDWFVIIGATKKTNLNKFMMVAA